MGELPKMTTEAKVKPVSMDTVNDGILHGKLGQTKGDCEVCGMGTRCLHIYEAHMPEGIDIGKTIAHSPTDTGAPITLIGIGCGCYAKFHRQVAHIQDKMTARVEKKEGKKAKGKHKARDEGGKKKKKHGRQ